jgi:hypothetical protein
MAGVLLNQGEGIALEALVNKTAPQTLVLRLFQNNWTPAEGETELNAVQATFTGYAGISLTPANWVTTLGAPTSCDYAEQTFTSSADQTVQQIYGYYLTQTTSGKAVWAERFTNGPYPVQLNNDAVKVTVSITQD